MSELISEAHTTNNRLQSLEARLSTIEQAVQEDPEVTELANEVFTILPSKAQIEEYNAPEQSLPAKLPEEQGGPIAYSGRVADVAALTDSNELQVQRALDKLQSNTARVHHDDGHDERRYYKEV
ncbi:hypothetical protein K6T50_05240 [Halobaculum magnesiiphilum]|uniref:Uncharacterized protein n=1 Tax=Halobaculum magnesiiphilum TaxID=1017351 RepID=A0A8T8WFB2_9EURY|nr:hypothetical protein K6T50_05240 [Halobaculum magnesiiphilum]